MRARSQSSANRASTSHTPRSRRSAASISRSIPLSVRVSVASADPPAWTTSWADCRSLPISRKSAGSSLTRRYAASSRCCSAQPPHVRKCRQRGLVRPGPEASSVDDEAFPPAMAAGPEPSADAIARDREGHEDRLTPVLRNTITARADPLDCKLDKAFSVLPPGGWGTFVRSRVSAAAGTGHGSAPPSASRHRPRPSPIRAAAGPCGRTRRCGRPRPATAFLPRSKGRGR